MSETGDVEFEPDAQYVAKLLAGTVGLAAIASLAGLKPPLPLLIPPLLSAITLVKKPELDLSTLKTRGGMNSELLAPAGVAAGCKPPPSGTAKVYPVDKQTLKDRFLRVIAAQPRTVLSVVSQDKETYGFVARSLLMQYPDLVTVSFLDVEPGQSSTLAIYSQSIYGQGDLGANKKRVTEWLAALDKEL
ncbi:hypothetical protein FVE85_3706 [Porphyridium purpureum]|uniref:DUF1499 domain-containing protein n=1 Tax=Porphyridium purpureum TaxID=35688 RepID=A0A5J4YLZ2_PORPP|nr:hypothetical protein FVE85_3706 [Porphyridium purpureum]|eukprot:POR2504..scf249_10